MTVQLKAIKRYPVKGLSGIEMPAADITAHKMLQDDRRFIIATQSSVGQDGVHEWARKSNFLQLVNTPKLAFTSRKVVWLFLEHLGLDCVPVLHCLQGRPTAQG